jgi:hypothetical protein
MSLSGQFLSPFSAPPRQYTLTLFGRHAHPETMPALAS